MTTIQDIYNNVDRAGCVLNLFDMTTIQDHVKRTHLNDPVLNLFDMTTIQDQHFNIIYSLIHITPVY